MKNIITVVFISLSYVLSYAQEKVQKEYEDIISQLESSQLSRDQKVNLAQSYIDKCNVKILSGFNECKKYIKDLRKYTIVPCIDPDTSMVGFCYPDGSVKIKGSYRDAHYFSEGLAVVKGEEGDYGVIDEEGLEIVPVSYKYIGDFNNGLSYAVYYENNKKRFCIITKSGEKINVNDFLFSSGGKTKIGRFSPWLFYVMKEENHSKEYNNKLRVFDSNGKRVSETDYDWPNIYDPTFYQGLLGLKDKISNKYTLMDVYGKIISSGKYNDLRIFYEGYAAFSINKKLGFIDQKAREVIPAKYDAADRFSEGLAAVKLNGKWGFIDREGEFLINPKYTYARSFHEGLAAACNTGKCGYIDKSGNFAIKPRYDDLSDFSNGLAAVSVKGKSGVIDRSGNEVVPVKYDSVEIRDYIRVEIDGKTGFIDLKGKELTLVIYSPFTQDCGKVILAYLSGEQIGALSKDNGSLKEIVAPKYRQGECYGSDMVALCSNSGCGVVDSKGNFVVPANYNEYTLFKSGNGMFNIGKDGRQGFIDLWGREAFFN